MSVFFVKIIFGVSLLLIFYTFFGYGILISLLNQFKKIIQSSNAIPRKKPYEPEVTFVIPAYNEERWIIDKIQNSIQLDYPSHKIFFLIVSDGSNDNTKQLVDNFKIPLNIQLKHFHESARKGKIAAVERIMPTIQTPITIFTDANTVLNRAAVKNIVRHFTNPKVGVVAGEKRIYRAKTDAAAASGEGFYWQYESFLKKLDGEFYSVIGAAGELFAIRTALYAPIPKDSIIEDFYMTMTIAAKGYRIAYAPDAYAMENGSASVQEELKRKIRIAAGGFQSMYRLAYLLNPLQYGRLSFQFLSRRIFRWVVVPIALPLMLFANIYLASQGIGLYPLFLIGQFLFYALALMGYLLERKKIRFKILFIPYYFCIMHYAVYKGFIRFLKGNQSVLWERAERA